MQANIHQAGKATRQVTGFMHHRICQHAACLPSLQQRVGRCRKPADMSWFKRHQTAVALAQNLQKILCQYGIEGQAGRQLHQQGAKFFTQAADLRQKVVEQPTLIREGGESPAVASAGASGKRLACMKTLPLASKISLFC